MTAARAQLLRFAAQLLGRLRARAPRRHHLGEPAVAIVRRQPLACEARIEQLRSHHPRLVGRHRGQLLQRIGRAARAARRRAEQREPLDPIGHSDGELLRDHAAEADTDDARAIPADVIEQRDRVGRVVGHLVRAGRARALTEPALVVHEHVEVGGEQLDEQLARRDRRARAVSNNRRGPSPDRS